MNGWSEIVRPVGIDVYPLTIVAQHIHSFFDTRSLLKVRAVSRRAYHGYTPHLDRRLIRIFGLVVGEKPSHQDVMQALVTQVAKGETSRAFTQLSALLRDHRSTICYFFGWNKNEDVSKICKEIVPLNTRDDLVELCSKLWVKYSSDIKEALSVCRNSPDLQRFLFTVGRNILMRQPEQADAVMLTSYATGAFLTLGQGDLQSVWDRFSASWNSMGLCQQAISLECLGRVFTMISSPAHPAVPFVWAFVTDKAFIWKEAAMGEACSHIVELRSNEFGHTDTIIGKACYFDNLLTALAETASHKEAVRQAIFAEMRALIPATDEEIGIRHMGLRDTLARAEMQTDSPSAEAISRMLCYHPTDELFLQGFEKFKERWVQMSASEQAAALFHIGEPAYYHIMGVEDLLPAQILHEFVFDETQVWRDTRLQKAARFLVQEAINGYPLMHTHYYNTIVEMMRLIAKPALAEADRDTVRRLLSEMVTWCQPPNKEEIGKVEEEWKCFQEQLSCRESLASLSLFSRL